MELDIKDDHEVGRHSRMSGRGQVANAGRMSGRGQVANAGQLKLTICKNKAKMVTRTVTKTTVIFRLGHMPSVLRTRPEASSTDPTDVNAMGDAISGKQVTVGVGKVERGVRFTFTDTSVLLHNSV